MALESGNVLLVSNYRPGVGYAWWLMERFWLAIGRVCAERGDDCFLAYPREGEIPEAITGSEIQPIYTGFGPGRHGGWWTGIDVIRQRGIRGVYTTDRAFFDLGYLLLRAAGVRSIVNHDHTPGDRPTVGGIRGLAKSARNALPGSTCDHWICVSDHMRTRAIRNGRIPARRVSVVQNGISPITLDPAARERVCREFGIPSSHAIVVTVGRAHPIKRIDFVVRVAKRVQSEPGARAVTFIHLGDGPLRPELEGLARELGVDPGRFVFAGHRSDVRSILPGCDLALHPSAGEGFSLAILEYMSAGLATLVPAVPSVSQAITDGVTGFVFEDGDEEAAARLVTNLATDPAKGQAVGAQAATTVRNRYSLERCEASFTDLIRRIL